MKRTKPNAEAGVGEPIFLFSIDLEDVVSIATKGERFSDAVPALSRRWLAFLDEHGVRCTFFVVGETARRHPDLVAEILAAGHEIACHSSEHRPLEEHDPLSFRDDVQRNLDDLARAGATDVVGFRAPTFSLTPRTAWAHEVLFELGMTYSSSILGTRHPLYGWPGFGGDCRRMAPGIWEIPATLSGLRLLDTPFGGGVYFRVMPFSLIRHLFRRAFARGEPVVGYMHPYDIDTEQERFMHPGLGGNRMSNALMYIGRSKVFPRLAKLFGVADVVPYREYVQERLLAGEDSRG